MAAARKETQLTTIFSDDGIGSVTYDESVFRDIAEAAAKEVGGVVNAHVKNIDIDQEHDASVGLGMLVSLEYKETLIGMAKEMQRSITRTLRDMTGSNVEYVNIEVNAIHVGSM